METVEKAREENPTIILSVKNERTKRELSREALEMGPSFPHLAGLARWY